MSKHRCEPGLCIVCGIDACKETYKNYDSYRTHVYRKHRDCLVTSNDESELPQSGSSSTDVFLTENSTGPELEVMSVDPIDTSTEIFSKRSSALFLLKTREERRVTQTSLIGIIQDFRGFWRDTLETLKVCCCFFYFSKHVRMCWTL